MIDRARAFLTQACDAAAADFRSYHGGRNVPQDVANIQASLEQHLVDHPGRRPGWQRVPELTEHLLELHVLHPEDYRAFLAALSSNEAPTPMEVLWQMSGIIGTLVDDHDYVLWGELGEQVLMRQHRAPAWTRGCNPDDVAEALQARLARMRPQDKPSTRKSPRP